MSFRAYMRRLLLTHPKLNPYRFSPNYTFRFLTSSFRHLPHFLIIGTIKLENIAYYHI